MRVLHFEDKKFWRDKVKGILTQRFGEVDYTGFSDLEAFRRYSGSYSADVYVVDRHVPAKDGLNVDDFSWQIFARVARSSGRNAPIIMLSRKPLSTAELARSDLVDVVLSKSEVEENPAKFIESLYMLSISGVER